MTLTTHRGLLTTVFTCTRAVCRHEWVGELEINQISGWLVHGSCPKCGNWPNDYRKLPNTMPSKFEELGGEG